MIDWIKKLVGTKNEREIRRIRPYVDQINKLESEYERYTDAELGAKTGEFKNRIAEATAPLKQQLEEATGAAAAAEPEERDELKGRVDELDKELRQKEAEVLEELVPQAFAAVREASRREGATSRRRGIEGRLENLALAEIVQMLHIGNKTALVTLSQEAGRGKIWFELGTIRHAKVGALEGEEAVFAMLEWKEGGFRIEHGVRTKESTVESDPMWLVMEGLRGLDPVAYVRFASVYRDFREAADFQEVLSEIAAAPVAPHEAVLAFESADAEAVPHKKH